MQLQPTYDIPISISFICINFNAIQFPLPKLCKTMSRWIEKIFKPCSGNETEHPIECYACTQVGVPIFHSTTCDPVHQPEWEALAGSSLVPIVNRSDNHRRRSSAANRRFIHDPRSKYVQRWNRLIVLARGVALAVDPLFLFSISVGVVGVYMDCGAARIATVIRTCVDVVHVCHLWLRFRLAYVSKESLVVGCGKLVWDARAIASHYLLSFNGFWLDTFVILPIPQAIYWLVVPTLIRENRIGEMMTILQLIFLLQFLPKVYHCFCLMRGMRKVTGYIFGTIWWGFGLNLIAYFLASHAFGGYWYILAVRRIASCFAARCSDMRISCSVPLPCLKEVCHPPYIDSCGNNLTTMAKTSMCLDGNGPFRYGIYQFALPLISSNSFIKILYSNLWGLMTLSTMGNNLEPTSRPLELFFSISMVLSGLMLFTLLIGNIQVFLHAVMVRKRKMMLRYRDLEWWMKHRQLPNQLRRRVRKYEHQRWEMMGGEDEMELITDLPEGLRRDIKRYLCLEMIKKVPLFHSLDDVVLDNICDRVRPLVYLKDDKIIREGDPVQRIIFIMHGQVKRNQGLSKGTVATSILRPGSFIGDELISWCLRRPFLNRLPVSSATFTCVQPAEAFGLEADELRYVTDHFRYHFANEVLKRTARYYSSNWRSWAAVNIQLAWRRYTRRTRNHALQNGGSDSDRRLRQCAAMFMSLKPHDHFE